MSQGIETTTPRSSRGTSRQPRRLPARLLSGIVGLLMFVLLTASYAQQAAPSGEEVYVDRLGCWNCHGTAGAGGAGRVIAKTRLPLRRFVSYVRLPSAEMPPYAPLLASDAELAIVYRWLDGIDAVKTPPPITLTLKGSAGVLADGQAKADTEVELTAETALEADGPVAPMRYRIMLVTQTNDPVANRTFECQLAGREGWSKSTTDEHGEAFLSADRGFVLTTARLRIALAPGRYALVVEAIDDTTAANPVVVGIGTTILRVA